MRFEEVVERHQHRIFSFACYLLSDRGEAEDVTQEVFLKLWRHRQRLDAERVGGWLLQVTRNACYDALRRRAGRHGRSESLDESGVPEPAAGDPGPEEDARSASFRRRLGEAVGRLPEPYRSVVVLREIHGLAYKEIAEALEMPLNSVRVTLHRARRKLRERLREVVDFVPSR